MHKKWGSHFDALPRPLGLQKCSLSLYACLGSNGVQLRWLTKPFNFLQYFRIFYVGWRKLNSRHLFLFYFCRMHIYRCICLFNRVRAFWSSNLSLFPPYGICIWCLCRNGESGIPWLCKDWNKLCQHWDLSLELVFIFTYIFSLNISLFFTTLVNIRPVDDITRWSWSGFWTMKVSHTFVCLFGVIFNNLHISSVELLKLEVLRQLKQRCPTGSYT